MSLIARVWFPSFELKLRHSDRVLLVELLSSYVRQIAIVLKTDDEDAFIITNICYSGQIFPRLLLNQDP